jgi:HSP20 family protein
MGTDSVTRKNATPEVSAMATRVRADGLLDDLDAMGEQISRALGLRPAAGGARGWLPPVDIWENADELVIEIDAPGCRSEDLSAEVVDNQLVVSGERSISDGASRRYRSERWQGRFVRTFLVPPGVDNGRINAEYVAGVLRLRVPKPEEAKPRRIDIASDRSVIDVPGREAVGAGS